MMRRKRLHSPGESARRLRAATTRCRGASALLQALEPRVLLTTYGPLLSSTWAQLGPIADGSTVQWNQYAPIDPATQGRSLAGCVPVAVAEIANYWQFPKKLTITDADAYPFTFPQITRYPDDAAAAGTVDAAQLNSALATIDYTGDPGEEALLTFAIGIKSRAVFSSANTSVIPSAYLFGNLGFQSAVSSTDWTVAEPHVIQNIEAGMPAFLAIAGPGAAHAVVLDGYDDVTNQFHVRLGWGSAFDNFNANQDWFSLPEFSAGGFTFNDVTQVIYDIRPELPAPQNLAASQGAFKDRVHLSWDSQPFAQGYQIFRSTTNDPATAAAIATLPTSGTSFDDLRCAVRQTYFYWIKATSSVACPGSDFSDSVSGYSGIPRPATPQNLLPPDGALQVSLTPTLWTNAYSDPSGKAQAAAQWVVTRISDNTIVLNTGIDKKHLTQLPIPAGKLAYSNEYQWRVRFQNKAGIWSDFSIPTAFRTQAPPDLTPPAFVDDTWDIAPFALGPTSIGMTAGAANDPSGVQYYFHNLTLPGHDSGWQESPGYIDSGLAPGTLCFYQVMTRDESPAQNSGSYSLMAGAFTQTSAAIPGITPFGGTILRAATQNAVTSASTIYFSISFDSPVIDFNANAITLSGDTGAIVAGTTGSGTSYTLAITGMNQSGTILPAIAPGALHDDKGNSNTAILATAPVLYITLRPVTGNARSFFDEAWYLANNPDAAIAVAAHQYTSGWAHFLAIGEKQGRNPSLLFNETWYLAANPDVRLAIARNQFKDGFRHFVALGYAKKRPGIDLTPFTG